VPHFHNLYAFEQPENLLRCDDSIPQVTSANSLNTSADINHQYGRSSSPMEEERKVFLSNYEANEDEE
jgi:hypothetical protein